MSGAGSIITWTSGSMAAIGAVSVGASSLIGAASM